MYGPLTTALQGHVKVRELNFALTGDDFTLVVLGNLLIDTKGNVRVRFLARQLEFRILGFGKVRLAYAPHLLEVDGIGVRSTRDIGVPPLFNGTETEDILGEQKARQRRMREVLKDFLHGKLREALSPPFISVYIPFRCCHRAPRGHTCNRTCIQGGRQFPCS